VSALFIQCPGDTVQTGTGKVDLARKFKCTTAARDCGELIEILCTFPLNAGFERNSMNKSV